jgi:hypothetical protein
LSIAITPPQKGKLLLKFVSIAYRALKEKGSWHAEVDGNSITMAWSRTLVIQKNKR